MTQFPSDQLAKQYLQNFLEPLGTVQRNREVPGEAKFVDLWFCPDAAATQTQDLGLLGRMVTLPCLLEPFRNAPTRDEIRTCLLKLLWVQEDWRRKGKLDGYSIIENDLPRLWVLATRIDQPVLQELGGQLHPDWPSGVYFAPEILKTAVVAINQLPEMAETLWLRILGRGKTLERAVTELLALPADDSRRSQVLQLLTSWKVSVQLEDTLAAEEQELMATLSQAYLEWEQRTKEEGRQEGLERGRQEFAALILRQLIRRLRLDSLPGPFCAQIEQLPLPQLETLGEALLDFQSLSDLEAWLQNS